MQTSYPVFVPDQVLTSSHLNDVVDYLEEQDRLTRNKLIGIGIACGLEVSYEPPDNRIRITQGCAVTSEGYLIVEDETFLNRFRSYTLPTPSLEEVPDSLIDTTRYAFFVDDNGNQIPLWELLPTDYTPAPGEPIPTLISNAFLSDKVVLLFLERNLESLKNCDINDCSDKGIEIEFTLRRLLITRTAAQTLLDRERDIAQRPVDRHTHPGYDLKPLKLAKINFAANEINNFAALVSRILGIAFELAPNLVEGLRNSYMAYSYLFHDMYPIDRFPNGPFGSDRYFDNVWSNLLENIFLAQYFYDYMSDIVQAYNEFLQAAIDLEAECCPNPVRFPRHVLLGTPIERPIAPVITFNQPSDVLAFDPLSADTGLGLTTKPTAFRHHFIPSLLLDRYYDRLQAVRSQHYRLYLLAYRYNTENLMAGDIKITPSKEGDYRLSEKSIPFYYKLKFEDDLHRNWSFCRTTRNRLDQVLSYSFITMANHPLKDRMDDHNFYRVEGILGKPLDQVMQELLSQKRQLGLSFAIEPVFMGLEIQDDISSLELNQQAMTRAQQALTKLLFCRMRDLDIVFLILMATLFYYIFNVISSLSKLNTASLVRVTRQAERTPTRFAQRRRVQSALRLPVTQKTTEALLKEIRPIAYQKGDLTRRVTLVNDPKASIGKLYDQIKDAPTSSSNLFDRTVEFSRELDPDADPIIIAQQIYPSVALLAQAEEMIEEVSVPSLAEFNFQQFEVKYNGFSQAFDAFVARTDPEEPDPDPEIETTQAVLLANYQAIAATGPQAVVNNLATELQKRLNQIFQELLLSAYAKRHPGMEHKAGVSMGGTLILLYTHKASVANVLERNQGVVNQQLATLRPRFTAATTATAIRSPEAVLVANPASNDPLNDFVVLADAYVPYLCCDTDCSDIDLPQRDRPTPSPATLRGRVERNAGTPTAPRLEPIPTAQVRATQQETDAPVSVQVTRGNFTFTAPAGTYKIVASAPQFISSERVVTLTADSEQTENFVLEPVPEPATVKGTVFGNAGSPAAARRIVLENAQVAVINQKTNNPVKVQVAQGNYTFTAPAGTYRIEANAEKFKPQADVVALKPDSSITKDFTLEPV